MGGRMPPLFTFECSELMEIGLVKLLFIGTRTIYLHFNGK